jgi:demethylmenaquinone methyltransferase/2-methoxy-6-polyprenyl-1,4-benzoquinol methylase
VGEPVKPAVAGAAPLGTSDEQSAGAAVRQMFSSIAPRYDLLNHLLSCNVDRLWWRRAARTFAPILARPDARVLDLCCGTGDLALALRRETRDNLPPILAADFSHPMLERAARKFRDRNLTALEADALCLPFADSSFDLVVSAFGFRNLANYESGLREMFRILRPGGECGIL